MIFNQVCVFSHSGSSCAKITIIQQLSWLYWISAEELVSKQQTHSEMMMMMLPDPHVTGMSAVWSGRCEVVPVISNRGSQWGSMTDSYESEPAASNGAVLLFRNAYYKCHLSARPGSLPSLQHADRETQRAVLCHALPPDGSWREAWLSYLYMHQQWPYMENQHRVTNAGLFNILEFTFCKLSFTSRSAYLPSHYLQLLLA